MTGMRRDLPLSAFDAPWFYKDTSRDVYSHATMIQDGQLGDPAATRTVPVIGLVGGIGSGKSVVARQLQSLGCAVIDADQIAQSVLDQPEVIRQLIAWWGPDVVGPDGRVDRSAVAAIVFGNPSQLQQLEQLVHPRVHQTRLRLRQQFAHASHTIAIVEDCPLLLEKGLDAQCDAVVFVQASEETRLRRLAASRGWSREDLVRREKNQIGLDIKAKRADYTIDNNVGEDDCLKHVRDVLSQILNELS